MPTTFEKSWQVDATRVLSDNSSVLASARSAIWYIKAFLKGEIGGATQGLWTCVGSSDGVTAGMDGVDRFGAAYDGTKIVRAAAGTAHSWIVLRSPPITAGAVVGVPFYMIIDYSGTIDYQALFVFSKALPTGGTITARPTATDEWVHTTAQGQLVDSAINTYRWSGWLASDSSFAFVGAKLNAGYAQELEMFAVLGDPDPTDQYPVVSSINYALSGFTSTRSLNIRGRNANGITALTAGQIGAASGSTDWPSTMTAAGDATTSKYWDLQALVGFMDAGNVSIRGRLVDFPAACPGGASSNGYVQPPSGPAKAEVLGGLWFPLNGVVVAL